MPMVKPNTIDFASVVKMSRKVIVEKALSKNVVRLVSSLRCTSRNEPIMATNALYITNIGSISVVASTRVTTKNLNGLTAETSIASICSVTFIDPSSAPIFDPTLPAQIKAVTNGASALMIAIDTSDGSQEVAPKSASEGRDCFVKTKPVINAVSVIRGSDL